MFQLMESQQQNGIDLPTIEMCQAVGLARSDYYRMRAGVIEVDGDLELRDGIQGIALEWPSYGYRRITAELHRLGVEVNHKKVLQIMESDNLLCLRKKRFAHTTDSNHGYRVYPNLAKNMPLTGINQLWVADITYIRLEREFVYLAVIIDAYSRRCVGWELNCTLEASLATAALRMALETRETHSGLVHHSDQGVQYASKEYADLLNRSGIEISMSRRGNPYDNAKAESFIKTLKIEEVYMYEYESLAEARQRIGRFLEEVYNQKRLHSSIGYVPPVEFELAASRADEQRLAAANAQP